MTGLASKLACASVAFLAVNSSSIAQENFYEGKTITAIVGFSVGGGNDTYTRLLARHMPRHIPGEPTIIVQNVPGAGGQTSIRHVETADKDGLTFTYYPAELVNQKLIEPDAIAADFRDFAWIGSISQKPQVCYVWTETGIEDFDDLLAQERVFMGSSGPGGNSYTHMKILQQVLGVNLRIILGYEGAADRQIAMERGELHGDCSNWSSVPDDLLERNQINIVVSFSQNVPNLPEGVAFAGDYVTDPGDAAFLTLVRNGTGIGQVYAIHGDVPQDRIDILRTAFSETMRDPEFLEEAMKLDLIVDPLDGEQVTGMIGEMANAPPEVLDRAREILNE